MDRTGKPGVVYARRTRHVFVDETKARGHLVVAAAVQTNFLIEQRSVLEGDVPAGDVLTLGGAKTADRDCPASLPCARIFHASGGGCRL